MGEQTHLVFGEVVAVGEGYNNERGNWVDVDTQPGATVMFSPGHAFPVRNGAEMLMMVREAALYATIEGPVVEEVTTPSGIILPGAEGVTGIFDKRR